MENYELAFSKVVDWILLEIQIFPEPTILLRYQPQYLQATVLFNSIDHTQVLTQVYFLPSINDKCHIRRSESLSTQGVRKVSRLIP